MKLQNRFKTVLAVIALGLSTVSEAVVVSVDWQTAGDALITRDTVTETDWLDLTETNGLSRDEILPMLEVGGALQGWRYATANEVVTLFANFSIDISASGTDFIGNYLDPGAEPATGFLGNIVQEDLGPDWPYGVIGVTSSPHTDGGYQRLGISTEIFNEVWYTYYDLADLYSATTDESGVFMGHYLVQASPVPVPVPAAVWLFGSGLIGLAGIARRKQAV